MSGDGVRGRGEGARLHLSKMSLRAANETSPDFPLPPLPACGKGQMRSRPETSIGEQRVAKGNLYVRWDRRPQNASSTNIHQDQNQHQAQGGMLAGDAVCTVPGHTESLDILLFPFP